ncbi:hypothetical protein LJB89_02445 [Tyzzerella sp. OttesenSCG-928-J15]|nr:hypothetical protein [Tyzzerella sp. OttesenSCG-928-J15]
MICKNCKTAVDDNLKDCPNCGSPINNNHNKWKIVVAVLVVAAIVVAIYLNSVKQAELAEKEEPPVDAQQTEEPAPSEATTQQPQPEPEPEVESEAPTPTSDADLNKPIEEIWAMLDETAICVADYYDTYSETVVYLSRNGYLYEDPSRAYVTVKDLEDLTDIDEEYLDESIMFFYVRPADLAEYSYLRVSNSDELKIFVGFETKDGFAIAAEGEQGGIITREDLKNLLEKYKWDHGEIRKISFDSDEFGDVVKTLTAYTGNESGFDVRYMYRDDKYICVVASPKDKPMQINQYLLEDTGDIINVKLGNIEAFANYKKAINDYIPSFNQNLLPNYDLSVNIKYLASDFNNIVDAMLSANFIEEKDLPLSFASGTSDFVYFEFESGKHFVGNLEENTWKMYPVESFETARELMWAINKKAPVFIIKQY